MTLKSVGGVPVPQAVPTSFQYPKTTPTEELDAAAIAALTPEPLKITKAAVGTKREATPPTPTKARRASTGGYHGDTSTSMGLAAALDTPLGTSSLHTLHDPMADLSTRLAQLRVSCPLPGLATTGLSQTATEDTHEGTSSVRVSPRVVSFPHKIKRPTAVTPQASPFGFGGNPSPGSTHVFGSGQPGSNIATPAMAHYSSQALLHRPAEAAAMEAPRSRDSTTSTSDVSIHDTTSREEKLATKPLYVEHHQAHNAGEPASPEHLRPSSSTASQAGNILAEGLEEDATIPPPTIVKPALFNPEAAGQALEDLQNMTKAQAGRKKRSRPAGHGGSVPHGGLLALAGPGRAGTTARGRSPAQGSYGNSITRGDSAVRGKSLSRGGASSRGGIPSRHPPAARRPLYEPASGGEAIRCFYQDREGGCPRPHGECPFVHDPPQDSETKHIQSVDIQAATADSVVRDWDEMESVRFAPLDNNSVGTCSDVDMSDADSILTQHGSVMSIDTPSIDAPSLTAPSFAAPSLVAPSLAAPSFVASFASVPSAAPQAIAAQSVSGLSTGGQSAGSQYGGTNQSRKKSGNRKAPCAYYTTPGGCSRGMYCGFFHDPAYDADKKTIATEGMLIGPHLYPGRDRV
ncbi:hypothetical protein W97_04268 [Coniosporium apollinis CBS 100218]|uniref:C3H1-type domain-containing protein n=1 Tax=Coniosporium apollinis (strain CBS 100218) TaxID=1168221 RepID=R7YT69_CONA1|nr:uncharacterized protein W97_04268 [Coniosporium apollinis CBS 100218]EON65033.1 hypothetical protein W97_04268 [Coniosporium apollinis CBS 100218]